MKRIYILIGVILVMTGCAKIDYNVLRPNSSLKHNSSIVLIGTKGKYKVNYLQFESWSKMPPACNYRGIYDDDNVIALEIDTPQDEFRLGVYTAVGRVAGYTHTGSAYGYISVVSEGLNINQKGIYFYGILDTDTQSVNQNIDRDFLRKAKKK